MKATWLSRLGFILLAAVGTRAGAEPAAAPAARQPNIVFVLTDDKY